MGIALACALLGLALTVWYGWPLQPSAAHTAASTPGPAGSTERWRIWVGVGLLVVGLGGALALWPKVNRSLKVLELAMAGSHDGIFVWDPLTKRLVVGSRLLQILGYTGDLFPTSDQWLQVVHPDDRAAYNRAVKAHLQGLTDHFYCEYRVKAQNGGYVWLAARGLAAPSKGQAVRLMAGSVTNINDRVMRQQQIENLALTDPLTGLPNRRGMLERFAPLLAHATRQGAQVGVLFIDLDRFKDVNDTLGHNIGDEVLRALTRRLPAALRAYDVLTRQGGDELIVLLPDLGNAHEAQHVAQRVLANLSEPVVVADHRLQLHASVGLAMFPDDGHDSDTLLRRADLAMYEAKSLGGQQWRRYTAEMDRRLNERVTLEQRLRHAIAQHELRLQFQPQFDAATGKLVGAEALVRWTSEGRAVRPDVFVPVAEACGLIDALGEQVMHLALQHLARWRMLLPPGFRLGVNLSPRQFRDGTLDAVWLNALADHGVPAHLLALEVTESVLLDASGKAVAALERLRQAGIEIALDDFGTGYSSLSYLTLLSLDTLKIDKSFVMRLTHEADLPPRLASASLDQPKGSVERPGADSGGHRSHAVVLATLAMARHLGYRVVAEGVETEAQRAWLQTQGCDVLQGYLLARPMDPSDFEANFLYK